jgi:hypothetical protein
MLYGGMDRTQLYAAYAGRNPGQSAGVQAQVLGEFWEPGAA